MMNKKEIKSKPVAQEDGGEEHGEKIAMLMEKYHIDYLGGCPHCQPNGDWAEGWGCIPDELYREFREEDSCCTEIDECDIKITNYPAFCKYEEEDREE